MVREEFLEETLFALWPSRMRSLFLAEGAARADAHRCSRACCVWRTLSTASGSRAPAVSCFVLDPEDTVVPHASLPAGGGGRQMRVGQIILPMSVIAKGDACREGRGAGAGRREARAGGPACLGAREAVTRALKRV